MEGVLCAPSLRRSPFRKALAVVVVALTACTIPGRVTTVRPDGSETTELDVGGNDTDHLGGWSPDGKQVVLTSEGRVFTIARDGSGKKRLTRGEDPAWSPDGTRIVFVRDRAIHVIGVDGAGERRLADQARAPEWSPAGDRIVFEGQGPKAGIHVIASDGSGERFLVAGARPDWSRNGRQLVFTRGGDVHVINADGSGERRLATQAEEARWSPVEARLAVMGAALRVINSDGRGERVVVDDVDPKFDHAVDWSPDGRSLVFESRENISVVNIDGSAGPVVAIGARPVWSPDGEYIAYEGTPTGTPCHHEGSVGDPLPSHAGGGHGPVLVISTTRS